MSYILDAIKKSDREYQLQQEGGAAQFHYARSEVATARSPWLWLLVVCAVLLLILSSLAYYLVESGVVAVRLPAITMPEKPPARSGQEPDRVVPMAPSQPAGDAQPPAPQQADGSEPGLAGQQAPLALMPLGLRDRLGPLHFSLHVYSSQPEQRSIIINNRMMREGEWLTPDLLLHAITKEGVIMSAGGARYRVPVVNDWQ